MTASPLTPALAWMALGLIPGLGPLGVRRLVEAAGSAAAAVGADPALWREALGATRAPACRAALPEALAAARRQFAAARAGQAAVFTPDSDGYPWLLRQIADPPPALFVAGQLEPREACVAIVGSRRAGPYGLEAARALAGELAARGVTVVSGMAYGVDAAAHSGALDAGGRTVAVLGCGVDVPYPRGHVRLHRRIVASGAVVSECPMGAAPTRGSFPRRNRLISGLSLAVVVVEAPAHSGALITARCAVEQNRQVGAVPGSVLDGRNAGCHALLRDGAVLVESAADVLAALPEWGLARAAAVAAAQPPAAAATAAAAGRAAAVLARLGPEPVQLDALAALSGLAVGDLLGLLLELELAGQVRQWPGQRYSRAGRGGD